jgi:antitoxin MazE
MYIRRREMGVKVSEWGNSLAIRIPKDVVDALKLKKGDEIEVRLTGDRTVEVMRDDRRARAIQRLRELARPLPPGWKFSRDEIYDE